jgi:hypothetical protein
MGRTACTEPQRPYKCALYLTFLPLCVCVLVYFGNEDDDDDDIDDDDSDISLLF